MKRRDFEIMAIGHIMADSDELTLLEQLESLEKAEDDELVQDVPGLIVWDKFQMDDVGYVLEIVHLIADDLEFCYKKGLEHR